MKKIIIDAMGGDNGSPIVVEAVKNFLNKHHDVEIAVVGKQEELESLKDICRIIDARDVVPMDAGALEVMRLRGSSMMTALKTYKEEGYDAVVSCGSTGGFLSAATITLKMIPGVKRAALVSPFPSQIKGKKTVFLDIGANNENSAEELVQFATIGRAYSKAVFNLEQPKIYLLSNGSEEEKGAPEVKEAHRMMKESNFPGFMGNIEAVNALNGEPDVVVCGGFAGNIFLKSSEGMAKFMSKLIKGAFKKNLWTKIGYLHVRKGMKEMTETMDYKSTGGAMLLGVNGVVVKGHGNSDAYAFECAINVAYKLANADIVSKIKEDLEVKNA
ncbi:MAG: phosphate acyltransferase PlsX [Bacilli bacterium]|nr:phosphate acyltransferase PlsX [Bacilli bacterium]